MKRALVVEDDPDIVELITHYLRPEGFDVESVPDGRVALERLRGGRFQLLILDLQLPGLDGLSVCAELRRDKRTSALPIVMLTARGDEADRIVGLEVGADDYVVKPFSPKELVARVRAVFRRIDAAGAGRETIRAADLTLDVPRLRATVGDRDVELTPTEFELLATLARQPGRIFTRGQLLDAVHGVAFESYERAIDAHIKNIRRKLEPNPREPRYILTVYGMGYKFADE